MRRNRKVSNLLFQPCTYEVPDCSSFCYIINYRESGGRRNVQRRLISILKAFAAVNGPQQMIKHGLLRSIFTSLLANPDAVVSQLAFVSLLRFKSQSIVPYSSTIEKLFLKGKLRESLLDLKGLVDSDSILDGHRKELVPVLSRILFGRLSAKSIGKSSKDSPSARRSAVLSFLSNFCSDDDELYSFIYLMVRAYHSTVPIEAQDAKQRALVLRWLSHIKPEDVAQVDASVHQGFLNMLEAVVSHFGHRVTAFVPPFVSIIITIAKLYEIKADVHHHEAIDSETDLSGSSSVRAGTIRALCFRRLVDIFDKYQSSLQFSTFFEPLWDAIKNSIDMLPEMAINSDKPPSLLLLLETFSSYSSYVAFLTENETAVTAVLRCISPRSGNATIDSSLSFVGNLLEDDSDDNTNAGSILLRPHINMLLEQFAARLESSGIDAVRMGRSRKGPTRKAHHQTWKKELGILCRVSGLLQHSKETDLSATIETLCHLLLPFLHRGRAAELEQLNVLGILESLLPNVSASSVHHYYFELSQLLGPEKAKPRIESKQVRNEVAKVIERLVTSRFSAAKPVSIVLRDLCAFQSDQIDEIDFDAAVPALSKLGDEDSWLMLARDNSSYDPSVLQPVVSTCFSYLFEPDGLVSRSAFKAIKTLVNVVTSASEIGSTPTTTRSHVSEKWNKLLQGCIVPTTRTSLGTKDVVVRRYFVLILGEIAVRCRESLSPHLHGDLAQLARDGDPDLDFFQNITHVQIHRRARALQRLRKSLVADETQVSFHPQSLANVLLPLAVHPVYEARSSTDEGLALEAIATVGAISRLLSWNKYNSLLATTLSQFDRHPEQERYVVGLLVAVIDGFHFETADHSTAYEGSGDTHPSTALRALESRIIPKVETLLVKEGKDRDGERTKSLRPSIVLALLKLFQKLPEESFRSRLPRLLTIICDILKSRESNARDAARTTLAKMAVSMDVSYLADVIRALAVTLTAGYQLHVRGATVHSVLLSLSTVYKPPERSDTSLPSPFDGAVPGLMDLLQQDLFGETHDRKESQDTHVRYVKEARGSKSYHSLELISSMIIFRPSAASTSSKPASSVSSVHAVVGPFLERLRSPDITMSAIRRIRECLSRVVSGLSRNPSVKVDEVLKFVYATIEPCTQRHQIRALSRTANDDGSESDEDGTSLKPIAVSGTTRRAAHDASVSKGDARVSEWRPSALGAPTSAKSAREAKFRDERGLAKVFDGRSAPRLTGSNRSATPSTAPAYAADSPASITAMVFGLQVLHSAMKKLRDDSNLQIKAMLDPFIPLLSACVCFSSELDVIVLALRCLGLCLLFDLPSFSECAAPLASKSLDLLTSSGSSSNQQQEIIQASFKMLSFLMDFDRKKMNHDASSQGFPLTTDQMGVLLSYLRMSVVESEQHNPAIALVKSIMARRYASAELYDLMETFLEQSVRSSKGSLRQQSSSVFLSYLINYPLAQERVEQHMKQIVLNIQYEYSDGRLSAIELLSSVIEKVPLPVVDQYSQLFFLPLTLQLVNDESKECREAVAGCISSLFKRISTEHLQSLSEYVVKWSLVEGEIRRTALQLFGILVDSRPDFLRRNGLFEKLLDTAERTLQQTTITEWESLYFSLVSLEKAWSPFNTAVTSRTDLWAAVIESTKCDHPWVRLVSCRLLAVHFASIDIDSLGNASFDSFLVRRPGLLYQAARGFCHQLDLDDEQQTDEVVTATVKSLSWIIRAMYRYPSLCFSEDLEGAPGSRKTPSDPVLWLITRLSNIARRKGKRRLSVYKCFGAFATYSPNIIANHLELILEPLHRSELETHNELEVPSVVHRTRAGTNDHVSEESQLAKDVLHLLEERCDGDNTDGNNGSIGNKFLLAYGAVKARMREKKVQRKLQVQAEDFADPRGAAERKIRKQERDKQRRKRRVDERRQNRGGSGAKRRRQQL